MTGINISVERICTKDPKAVKFLSSTRYPATKKGDWILMRSSSRLALISSSQAASETIDNGV